MAHKRERHILELFKKLVSFSPIVGVFGHRQVGKTTLLSDICQNYVTMDVQAQRSRIELDPEGFLGSVTQFPTGIDEAQLVPELFPALKEVVRQNQKPGRWILSGSVRFTSRKAIRESLTGRIVNLELLPLSQSELDQRKADDRLQSCFKMTASALIKKLDNELSKRELNSIVNRYLVTGGLPGVSFVRSDQLRYQKFESQLETILDRDIRLVLDTKLSYSTLRNVLVNLAIIQGAPFAIGDLSRKTRVSIPTLKNLLDAFQKIFLIRILPTEGSEKRPVIFFEDQGEATHLLAKASMDPLSDLTRFLFSQIRTPLQIDAQTRVEYFQFRTRSGSYIPLAVRRGQQILGFCPILEMNPSRQAMASAISFLKHYPKARVLFCHPDTTCKVISENLIVLPLAALV